MKHPLDKPDSDATLRQPGWLRAPVVEARAPASLRDWFPVALDAGSVGWRHLPGRFTEPFFADSLHVQPPAQRRICHTGYDRLGRTGPGIAPSVFVFHSSRCGSTLLAQLLACLPQCLVLSEPPVIHDFFALHGSATYDSAVPMLRRLVRSLGQRRHGATHFVIKLDCWHIRHLPLLRAAFPEVPFWFLYRDPQAIMASHRRQRGPQMVPGLVLPRAFGAGLAPGDLEGWCAAVIADIFDTALSQQHQLRLLEYRQLPEVVWDSLLGEIGIACTPQQRDVLRRRAGFHAKAAAAPFCGDPPAAMQTVQHLLDKVAPRYERLEALRRQRLAKQG